MKMMSFFLMLTFSSFGQQQNEGDKIVSVEQKYVSAEGLKHIQPSTVTPENASRWVGVGKEVGVAVRDGLDAVVDKTEKFGTSKVGTFVMAMIAWKIMAKEVFGVILGLPLLVGGVYLWVYIAKRVFFGYRVLDKVEGKIKTYKDHDPIQFKTGDSRASAAVFMGASLLFFVFIMLRVIFN